MIKISKYLERLPNGDSVHYIRLRLKNNNKWKTFKVKQRSSNGQIEKLNDLAQEIASYKSRNESFTFELKERINKTIGDTAVRQVFVRSKLLDAVKAKDYTFDHIKTILEKRLANRVLKNEITAATKQKRMVALNKFDEFLKIEHPNLVDFREIESKHCNQFIEYLLYDRVVDGKPRLINKTTAQSEKKWIGSLFQSLVVLGDLVKNPFDGVIVNVDKSDDRLLTVPANVLWIVEQHLLANYEEQKNEGWYIYWMITRYLGSRKTEALQLRWKDVDFDAIGGIGAVNMPAPKTKKTGKSFRRCPMMNGNRSDRVNCDLRKALQKEHIRQGYPDGNEYVVRGILNLHDSKRDKIVWKNKNPSTTLEKLVIDAGICPWIKLIQNLRVTRANELTRYSGWRPEAIHAIVGHSRDTYEQNYADVTDDDYMAPAELKFDDLIQHDEFNLEYGPSYVPNFTTTGLEHARKTRKKTKQKGKKARVVDKRPSF
jgi:hypothetical protein